MATGDAAKLYMQESGAAYHAQRAGGRSDASQATRRDYFKGLSTDQDVVLDFGCATGGILGGMPAAKRIGVEVNETAAAEAVTRLDQVVNDIEQVADASVDRVMSFHALEHVADPIGMFKQLHRVLRPGGKARLVVPYESVELNRAQRSWRANDSDMHLFAWTPLTFGNALTVAGFEIDRVRVIHWASPGKLGKLLAPLGLRGTAPWIKALRARRFQIVADIHKAG